MLQLAAAWAHRLERGLRRPPVTDVTAVPISRFLPALRSPGLMLVHLEKIVRSALQRGAQRGEVSSLTWEGCLVDNADTDAEDNFSPVRSASSRRRCAPVQTSRCAAAIRSRHLICISLSFPQARVPRWRR